VTLGDWFDSNGLGDMMGGAGYCVELANTIPSAANITAYAQIVREKSVMRQVIDQATQLVESAYAGQSNGVELVDRGITELMALQKVETRSEYTLRQAMTLAFAEAERARELGGRIPGIASGLVDLDRILGGWHDSDLIVIGARPAQGKTAVLLNFATACALPSGIVSAEQPAQQIGARVMSIKSLVPAERMRNGRFEPQDLRKLENAVGELCERTCMIYDRSSPTIADVSRMARKWKQQNGIRVLFVDYVQRIEAAQTRQSANKAEKVGEVVRGLKNLARDLEIPVIALAQVGRQADGRQPGMGDLSDSSEIEKEADQILTLFRPGTADDNADDSEAIISVEKNRHGPCGEIKTVWIPETMRFLSRFEGDLP
jgi:replicative DNA helicase